MSTPCDLSGREMKTMYAMLKLSPAKAKIGEAASAVGMPQSTFSTCYANALRRIEESFPELKDIGPANADAQAAAPRKRKAKASTNVKEGPTPKKEKLSAAMKVEDGEGDKGAKAKEGDAEVKER